MKKLVLVSVLALGRSMFAADATPAASWHAQTLMAALGNVLVFALVGIMVAIIGFKLFDYCTPGDLQKEIIENKNIAAAIVAAAAIIGVSIIIAASMLG